MRRLRSDNVLPPLFVLACPDCAACGRRIVGNLFSASAVSLGVVAAGD
jgi:hypothetical protein